MRNKPEFTHNGSFGKSFVLLLRSILNIASFGFFWYALTGGEMPLVVVATVALTAMVMLNFVFPIIKK